MSTTPNEKLIDSLADLLLSWTGDSREAARAFVKEHRLVSVPRESDTGDPTHTSYWEYLTHDDRWRMALCGARANAINAARNQRDPMFGPQVREVHHYRIPGEPIDVEEGEL
jgi:hypothetical protein